MLKKSDSFVLVDVGKYIQVSSVARGSFGIHYSGYTYSVTDLSWRVGHGRYYGLYYTCKPM